MALLRQCLIVSRLNLNSLGQRFWSSIVIVVGMACVVGVLLSMLSTTAGMLRALRNSGDSTRAIILPAQSQFNSMGGITKENIGTILSAPGVAKGRDGRALGDGEVEESMPPSDNFAEGSLILKGIGAAGLAVRPGFKIVAGRSFRSGRHEMLVGIGAERVFGLKIGDKLNTPHGLWPIVGVFSDGGSALEGLLVGDADSIMSTWRRSTYDSVLVRLDSAKVFRQFSQWLTTNPTLAVTVEREADFYRRVGHQVTPFFTEISYLVGGIMAIGALLGAMRILYAAVSSRTREIATLRAIGYQPIPVAVSVLVEAAVLSLCGAVVGAAIAWLIFDGKHSSVGSSIFELYVSPELIEVGLGWALLIAILGGLLPAIRAARLHVADAMQVG